MKRLLTIGSLLLISIAYGESFKNPMKEEELGTFYTKLVYEMGSLLLISIAYGDNFKNAMKEEELSACYAKLICEMGKVDEFYEVATLAEPETGQEYANFLSQVFGVENPENTLEFWIKSTNTYCGLPEEQQKKAFNDWCTLVGEHMLKVCRDPTSEICVKSDLAADQFAGLLSKYKAIGFCTDMSDVPKEMTPKGLGKMASPFG